MPRKSAPRPPQPAPRDFQPLPIVARHVKEMISATPDEEARLLRAALAVQQAAPWQRLHEDALFVVANPETGQNGFVSVLGAGGETFGITMYRGEGAFFQLQGFLESVETGEADAYDLLAISQLQVMFETRRDLETWDKELFKRHKIAARGAGLFPTFRSLCPGFLPWRVDGAETRFLAVALEQLLELVSRPGFSEATLQIPVKGKATRPTFLSRVPQTAPDGSVIWHDKVQPVKDPLPYGIELPDTGEWCQQIAAKPVEKECLEIDFDTMIMPVAEPDARPYLPQIVMFGRQSQVVAQSMTTQGFWPGCVTELTEIIIKTVAELPSRPREIWFNDARLMPIMQVLLHEAKVKVVPHEKLPTLDDAFESMFDFMNADLPAFGDLGDLDFPFELGGPFAPRLPPKPH